MPLPPQKSRKPGKWNGINRCGGRDITPLQNYANDLNLPRGFLANLLHESDYLEEYQVIPKLNECELTFPNSDWFGVYITDLSGNGKYWFDANGNEVPFVYYFKVIEGPDGYPKINFATATFKKPPELENARPCVIRDGGCYTPGPERKGTKGSPGGSAASSATSTPAKKTKKAAPSPAAAPVVSIPSDSLQAAMEALQIGPKEAAPVGSTLPRDEAEKLDRKTMIDWMSTNMDPRDVLGCLESGALSAQDQAKIAQLREDIGAGVAPGGGGVEEAAVRAMQVLPSAQTLKMFKAISKKELMAELNAISNMNDRKRGIVQLCQRAGLNYQLDGSKIPKIIGPGGTTVRPEIAMEECARAEALRAHKILAHKVEMASKYAREIIAGKYPLFIPEEPAMAGSSVAGPSGVSAPSGQMTPTQANFTGEFIDDLMGLLQNEEFEDFVAAINNTGLVVELREDGIYRDGVYVDTESEEMQDLIDEAALAYIKKYNVAFGRKRGCGKVRKNAKHPMKVSKVRSNFKCAAKKCKKAKGNYQACMRTTLRKMYKRSASFGKKSKGGSKVTKIFSKAAKHCKNAEGGYRKCMKKTLRKMHKRGASFGKRRKQGLRRRESKRLTSKSKGSSKVTKIFSKAAKHCKGSKNYRKCMKKTLRKMHKRKSSFGKRLKKNMLSFGKKRKRPIPRNKKMVYKTRLRRTHPKRKSPRMSATSAPVGTVKQGVDGNLWVIKKTKNGVKRWMKK
jgi:hypothetical protein